jgi:hypothetical protein
MENVEDEEDENMIRNRVPQKKNRQIELSDDDDNLPLVVNPILVKKVVSIYIY